MSERTPAAGSRTARSGRLAALALVAIAASALAVPAPGQSAPDDGTAPEVAKIGRPAPDFSLADTKGQARGLSDVRDRIVVLEWINPECPYVQRLYRTKAMQRTYRKLKELDPSIAWLAINSTHGTTAGQNEFWIDEHGLEYPILLDEDGRVGRRYDARRTPHMFVIDAKGVLRYEGAVDDNPLGTKGPDETKSYVVAAVKQILEGAAVAPDRVKPYGCTVKYRR